MLTEALLSGLAEAVFAPCHPGRRPLMAVKLDNLQRLG